MKDIALTSKRKKPILLPVIKDYIIQPNRITKAVNDYTLYQERTLTAIMFYLQRPISLSFNNESYQQLNLFQEDSIVLQIPLREISKPREYPKVKKAIEDMAVKKISFLFTGNDNKQMQYTSGLFTVILPTSGNGGGKISIKFDKPVARLLIEIDKDFRGNSIQYTRYMYQIAQSVKSPYTSKLYKLISSWKKKGGFYITKDQLYEQLGIGEGEYQNNSDFMRRIIKPAHKELFEKADCWFNCSDANFIARRGDKPQGSVLGFNFKVITPEFIEGENKKIDDFCGMLRLHFKCTDEDIKAALPLFEPDVFNYLEMTTKLQELDFGIKQGKINASFPNKYVITSLLNEFVK